jgi:hypothetical protein
LIVEELAGTRASLNKKLIVIPFLLGAGVGRGIILTTFAIIKIQLLLKMALAVVVAVAVILVVKTITFK